MQGDYGYRRCSLGKLGELRAVYCPHESELLGGGARRSGARSARHENEISNRHRFQSRQTQQGEVRFGVWVARGAHIIVVVVVRLARADVSLTRDDQDTTRTKVPEVAPCVPRITVYFGTGAADS